MTKAAFIRRGNMLVPVDDEAREVLGSVKDGREVMCDVRGVRSVRQHRLFFALLNLLASNSEQIPNVEAALTAVKIGIGETDPVIDAATGKTFWTLRSISFESCDAARFTRIFDRALHLITTRWLSGVDAEELRQEVLDLVDGPAKVSLGRRAA